MKTIENKKTAAPLERDLKQAEAELGVQALKVVELQRAARNAPYVAEYGAMAARLSISPREAAALCERRAHDSWLLDILEASQAQLLNLPDPYPDLSGRRRVQFTVVSKHGFSRGYTARAALSVFAQAVKEAAEKAERDKCLQIERDELHARDMQGNYERGKQDGAAEQAEKITLAAGRVINRNPEPRKSGKNPQRKLEIHDVTRYPPENRPKESS